VREPIGTKKNTHNSTMDVTIENAHLIGRRITLYASSPAARQPQATDVLRAVAGAGRSPPGTP
jgi:hypothetical protein